MFHYYSAISNNIPIVLLLALLAEPKLLGCDPSSLLVIHLREMETFDLHRTPNTYPEGGGILPTKTALHSPLSTDLRAISRSQFGTQIVKWDGIESIFSRKLILAPINPCYEQAL